MDCIMKQEIKVILEVCIVLSETECKWYLIQIEADMGDIKE